MTDGFNPEDPATDRRKHTREEFVQELADAIRDRFGLAFSEEEHVEHHTFVRQWIEREKRRTEFWDKIKERVGGWAIVSILGSIGSGAYHAFMYFKDHWQK